MLIARCRGSAQAARAILAPAQRDARAAAARPW